MKKIIFVFIALFFTAFFVFGQTPVNIAPLERDLNLLFKEIGRDVVPHIQQVAHSGDILGQADIRHFSFSFLAAGLTLSPGVGAVLDPDSDVEWEFNLFPLSNILEIALGEDRTDDSWNYYETASNFFPYPSLKMSMALGLWNDYEFIIKGFYIPQAVVDFGLGVAGVDEETVDKINNVNYDIANIGFQIRRVLISDEKFRPAISIGIGYQYSKFALGLDDVSEFLDEPLELGEGQEIELSGGFDFATTLHSFGFDFHVSKRLFIFTPFVKLSPYYQLSSYDVSTDLNATLLADPADPNDTDTNLGDLNVGQSVDVNDLSIYLTGGMELNLFIVILSMGLTVNLENPTADLDGIASIGEITDLKNYEANGIGANIGLRFQF